MIELPIYREVALRWISISCKGREGGGKIYVEEETIVGNVNFASNRDFNHGAIIWIYLVYITKVLLLLNEHGDPHVFSKFKFLF